jgi:hypothetical protein
MVMDNLKRQSTISTISSNVCCNSVVSSRDSWSSSSTDWPSSDDSLSESSSRGFRAPVASGMTVLRETPRIT